MTDSTFDIHALANEIFEVVCNPVFSDNPAMLLTRIKAILQRNIDTELVPKNFNGYVGKRKRDKWLRQLQRNDQEIKFWKRIVQEQNPNVSMPVLYEQLNSILSLSNLKNTAVPNSAIYCYYCEREMDAGKFGGINGRYATEDHIQPKAKFGKSGQDNLINACNECNSWKSDLTLSQFILKVKMMLAAGAEPTNIPKDCYPTIIKNAETLLLITSKQKTA